MFNTKIVLAVMSAFAFTGAPVKTIRTTKSINHANGGRTKIFKKTVIKSRRPHHPMFVSHHHPLVVNKVIHTGHPMVVRKTTTLVPTSTIVTHTRPVLFTAPVQPINAALINITI
jgi:hypothetical protein